MNKNNTNKVYKLGKSIAQIVPFHRIPIKREQQQKEIITSELVITMVVIQSQKLLC